MANLTDVTKYIPTLNFATPIGIDDLEFGVSSTLSDELCYRLQIAMQYEQATGARYGIVDDADPTGITTSSSRPLAISANANSPLLIDCQPGVAVTKSGHIILLTSEQEGVELADSTNSVTNVVFVEYETVEDSEYNVETRYGSVASKRLMRPSDDQVVQSATLTDFQDASIFSDSRRNDIVVLGVVTPTGTTPPATPTELSFDLASTTYSWNRPWFSVVDIEHRNDLGTGSSTTPHSLGLSDISQGDLTLYQQALNHGMVLSRDLDFPGCPGKVCHETIPFSDVLTDSTGAVTGNTGVTYARLQDYPIRLLGAFSNTDSDNAIAINLIPYSNIIRIAGDESIPDPEGFTLYYTSASACAPPTEIVLNDEFTVSSPQSHELVISGGKGLSEISQTTVSFGASGPIPKNFNVYCDSDGDLLVAPQILLCYKKLDDIGTSIYDLDETTLRGLAPVRIGLTIGGGAYPSLDLKIKVVGKDKDDLSVNEEVQFTNSNWSQPVTGPTQREAADNFQITTQLFRSVDSIQVTNRVGDSASSAIIVYADIAPDVEEGVTDELNDMLPVAFMAWNGLSADMIRDARPVNKVLQIPSRTTQATRDMQAAMGSVYTSMLTTGTGVDRIYQVLAEDMDDPYYAMYGSTRLNRHADGLRSAFLPDAIDLTTAPMWTSRAVELEITPNAGPPSSARLHVYVQGVDQIYPNIFTPTVSYLEWRWASVATPDVWGAWNWIFATSESPDNMFMSEDVLQNMLKLQIRAWGLIRSIVAFVVMKS